MSTQPHSATPTPPAPAPGPKPSGSVSTAGAIAIGVGGMMGAGLYTLLGLAATIAGPWIPVSFVIGGAVAAFSVYSYAKLGARFPSRGGAGEFLVRGFGDNTASGGLNVFQYMGWIVAMSLYAVGFGGYAANLMPWQMPDWAPKAFGIGLVVLVVLINLVGSKWVSGSELFVVGVELVIILIFLVLGIFRANSNQVFENFQTHTDLGWIGILFAAGLLYVTYEGFGVVTNSAGDMKNAKKQLPRSMYTALILVVVVYVLVSSVVVAVMSVSDMTEHQGHVLAEAARIITGEWGFLLLSGAALLATASAVNATMFGDANLSYMMATKGEMPKDFTRGVWKAGKLGLFITAALTAAFVLFFPLSAVGELASLAFLLIYASVSIGHLRVRTDTGARAWLLWVAIILNLALFALLFGYTIWKQQTGTWITLLAVLIVSFGFEISYRRITGRKMRAGTLTAPVAGTAAGRTAGE